MKEAELTAVSVIVRRLSPCHRALVADFAFYSKRRQTHRASGPNLTFLVAEGCRTSRVRVCGVHRRRNIRLSAVDHRELEAVVADRATACKSTFGARSVLLTADGRGTTEILQATGKAKTVIWRWQERFRNDAAAGLWRDKTRHRASRG